MGRVAVKFAYDGTRFMGSQRQPQERTVESELLKALLKIGAITSANDNRFRMASRTDRGVSALGNVFAVDTDFKRSEILAAMNASCRNVYCYAWADVPDTFSPRRAAERWYRYHLPFRGQNIERMMDCAKEFEGEHEFRLFCKPDDKVTLRRLGSVEVRCEGAMIIIDLHAREFLRNMVRRIVSAIDQAGSGTVTVEEVRSALKGEGRSMGLAAAEGLFLMDVRHDLEWTFGPTGPMLMRLAEEVYQTRMRLLFHEAVLEKSMSSQ